MDAPATHPTNRLARETSPYLLQHAGNPVDWYPWGEEAFAKARAEDKPILLSVGYATCHWCHVMERESFEDEAIASQLRAGFVAMKVDREELPDVDHVYMSALQAMTGRGGWPMNMFLTPQLKPFFGGSYFAPTRRHGLLSFSEVLAAVSEAWTTRRSEIEEQAEAVLTHVRDGTVPTARRPSGRLHDRAVARLARSFDEAHGGFGSAPKFPQAPLLQYLLTLAATGDDRARTMLVSTLQQMAAGGMLDHVGGGFARYSTDQRWHVPHFEKMLYDNAQLARLYADAYRLTGDERLRVVAEDTLEWLRREMHPAAAPAAFSSAQDADSEGIEGKFYVWTAAEFATVLGADADPAARLYGVTEPGNWEHGLNVLERRAPEAVRAALSLDADSWRQWEQSVRERLYAVRSQRIWPITDDKVLADWNGMALRAFAEAGRLLGRADFIETARSLARFLLGTMVSVGRLHHAWRDSTLRAESYLSDHAQVGLGLLELHAATGELEWLKSAYDLAERMVEKFHVEGEGFYDGEPGHLPVRARDPYDGAVPSATAAACELLARLAGTYDRGEWADIVQASVERQGALLEAAPAAVPSMLLVQLLSEHGAELLLPAGGGPLSDIRSGFAPLVTFVSAPRDAVPLAAGRDAERAYLCQHGACQLPATTPVQLRGQLVRLHSLQSQESPPGHSREEVS
jgi:uncharacterized protein YyaL (SSP411 family)